MGWFSGITKTFKKIGSGIKKFGRKTGLNKVFRVVKKAAVPLAMAGATALTGGAAAPFLVGAGKFLTSGIGKTVLNVGGKLLAGGGGSAPAAVAGGYPADLPQGSIAMQAQGVKNLGGSALGALRTPVLARNPVCISNAASGLANPIGVNGQAPDSGRKAITGGLLGWGLLKALGIM